MMKLYTGNTQDIPPAGVASTAVPKALLESQLTALQDRLRETSEGDTAHGDVLVEVGRTLLRLEREAEAWGPARRAFDIYIAARQWEKAVEATEVLFLSGQPGSLSALGQGVWLAVTFPIDPNITVEMLRRIVEETPDDSDGAAVAAATAHYVADPRSEGKEKENLLFYTAQMLSSVARRHAQVEKQEDFDAWRARLELDDPDKFLIRLRNDLFFFVNLIKKPVFASFHSS